MRRLRSTGAALFVALFLALALFTTGAFARNAPVSKSAVAHAVVIHTPAARLFSAFHVNLFRGAPYYRGAHILRSAPYYRGAHILRSAPYHRGARPYRYYRNNGVAVNVNAFSFAGGFGSWGFGCCDCCWSFCDFGW